MTPRWAAAALAAALVVPAAAQQSVRADSSAAVEASLAEEPVFSRRGERIELLTDDGWTLAGEYWRAVPGERTFVLLHGLGGRRQDWEPLRRVLFANGFGILAYDARGHGESLLGPSGSTSTWRRFKREGQDNEWNRMTLDLDAAARYLEEDGVETGSIAVAGASVGANIALKWAAVRPDVPMAILLSPGINYRDVLSVGAMRAWGPRPVLLVAGERDRHILLATKVLYDNARYHSGERFAAFWPVPRGHGTRMLSAELASRIVDWVRSPIRPVEASTAAAPGDGGPPDDADEGGAYVPLLPLQVDGIQ